MTVAFKAWERPAYENDNPDLQKMTKLLDENARRKWGSGHKGTEATFRGHVERKARELQVLWSMANRNDQVFQKVCAVKEAEDKKKEAENKKKEAEDKTKKDKKEAEEKTKKANKHRKWVKSLTNGP